MRHLTSSRAAAALVLALAFLARICVCPAADEADSEGGFSPDTVLRRCPALPTVEQVVAKDMIVTVTSGYYGLPEVQPFIQFDAEIQALSDAMQAERVRAAAAREAAEKKLASRSPLAMARAMGKDTAPLRRTEDLPVLTLRMMDVDILIMEDRLAAGERTVEAWQRITKLVEATEGEASKAHQRERIRACYGLWRDFLVAAQDRLKVKLGHAGRIDRLSADIQAVLGLGPEAVLRDAGFTVAEDYLHTAQDLWGYPKDETGLEGLRQTLETARRHRAMLGQGLER